MKSLGEILKTAREAKGLTPQQVSRRTKIELKYILALEANDNHKLPPSTFVKGFVRNYAQFLGKNPDELVAIYRRDASHSSASTPPPSTTQFSLKATLLNIPKSTLLLTLSGVLVFLGYFVYQYRAVIVPPPLEILQPNDKAVLTSPVTIEGKTSPDSEVVINSDTRLQPDPSGNFLTQLNYSPGDHQITLSATNRFGRTASRTLTVSIISQ